LKNLKQNFDLPDSEVGDKGKNALIKSEINYYKLLHAQANTHAIRCNFILSKSKQLVSRFL